VDTDLNLRDGWRNLERQQAVRMKQIVKQNMKKRQCCASKAISLQQLNHQLLWLQSRLPYFRIHLIMPCGMDFNLQSQILFRNCNPDLSSIGQQVRITPERLA